MVVVVVTVAAAAASSSSSFAKDSYRPNTLNSGILHTLCGHVHDPSPCRFHKLVSGQIDR
jgi:hypothetical protein